MRGLKTGPGRLGSLSEGCQEGTQSFHETPKHVPKPRLQEVEGSNLRLRAYYAPEGRGIWFRFWGLGSGCSLKDRDELLVLSAKSL